MSHELEYRPSNSAVYYVPPRRFDPLRLAPAMLACLIGAVAAAWLYVLWLHHARSLYYRVAAPILFGVALGLMCTGAMRFARVYSAALALLLSCAIGLAGLYASWAFWLEDIVQQATETDVSPWHIARDPRWLYDVARELNDLGTWSYKNDVIRGTPLTIVWIVEAAIIVTGAAAIGMQSARSQLPICPTCRVLCKQQRGMPRIAADREDDADAAVEARDFDALLEHGPLEHEDDPQIDFVVHSCPRCDRTHVLTVKTAYWVVGADGRHALKQRVLVNQLLITAPEVEHLKQITEHLKELESGTSVAQQETEQDQDQAHDDT